jgi:hypothetical protein
MYSIYSTVYSIQYMYSIYVRYVLNLPTVYVEDRGSGSVLFHLLFI